MVEQDHNVRPGSLLPAELAKPLIAAFRGRYRANEPEDAFKNDPHNFIPSAKLPTWMAFPSNYNRLTPEQLPKLPIPPTSELLLYSEFPHPGEIRRATWESILRYYNTRHPHDRGDTYVFPDSLAWCICYTHEDLNGIDVILAIDITTN
jgi:hypothetical protein